MDPSGLHAISGPNIGTTVVDPLAAAHVAPYLDYDPVDYIICGCTSCSTWWAEVVRCADGQQVVREWHDPQCAVLLEWQ